MQMDYLKIIDKYYDDNQELKEILMHHSFSVADKALEISLNHPELKADNEFLKEAAMIHDIGIFLTDAKGICCFGSHKYICHGYLGAEIIRREGYERHSLVCERHTGAGISLKSIIDNDLPIPHREMIPISIEEQIICFADKFFSKSHLNKAKTVEEARKSLLKYGEEGVKRFDHWCELFL